ncbi:alpha amylase catalytic region [Haladaptatus paucihalophilus DX253]|uniref:Alpha amylase catalytic region n=1 Tax=Haladaptatus paucihalophilus DX253 TaxID=797209 RepID=E7QVQ6_HALPU|nr:alpha-glucosidase [Haladaptatus paucihalophilus]EFW91319.1 alpha amylase catalytic region [Haladaptatus paucihalophilus DX253]SHL10634.1 oligo-1,6-glucosidase [Haladaptatus paucihalophilus DX253]
MGRDSAWWKEAVVYQIYPRSFYNSDADGIGDLRGIREKVDYLDELGVDVVWLNPVYDSPLVDGGYDVREYRSIHPDYGAMDDWEALRDELHERGIRLIMDMVTNHTSDEHEWFRKSRRGEDPYRKYYWWAGGDPDSPPNNWESFFGGPAWSYDERREAWYLHLFDQKQPDLNWRNPAVREDIFEMLRWWLEKDCDGFRFDVINLISKPSALPDGDPDSTPRGREYFIDGPRVHEYVREMYDRVLSEYDIMTVGETSHITVEEARRFYEDGLDMVFTFQHLHIDRGDTGPWDFDDWDLDELRDATAAWQRGVSEQSWNSLFLGNHDQPRMVSRFGDEGRYRVESAKMLATYLFTLRGTPFVYQGDELGMTNPTFERLDEYRDEETIQQVMLALRSGGVSTFDQIREAVDFWSRDNARTPIPWSDERNAGFTDGEPWIKVCENYPEVNVERERDDEDSVLQYYRRLIDLRHSTPVMVYGRYAQLLDDHPEIYAYLRTPTDGSRSLLVVLNFFDGEPTFRLPNDVSYDRWEKLIGNYESASRDSIREFDLRPYEALVYALE